MTRYLIGFLAVVGLGILLIILLTSGGGHKATPPTTAPAQLPSYADTSAQVEMVVDGPIIAPSQHNSADITVSQNSINFNLYQGYDGNVVKSKDYNNTQNSYRNFLYAIYYAGFQTTVPSTYTSDIGLCASGDRYDFYLKQDGNTLQHTWITSCASAAKTFGGSFNRVNSLFEKQVADLDKLIQGTNF